MLVFAPVLRASWIVAKCCAAPEEDLVLTSPTKSSLGVSGSDQKTKAADPPDDHWNPLPKLSHVVTVKLPKPGTWRMTSSGVFDAMRLDRIEAPSTLSALRLSTLADESTLS